jgi:hypothetical protein
MHTQAEIIHSRRHAVRRVLVMLATVLLFAASPIFAQQTYVTRFDTYGGYSFLRSPQVNLFENGFHYQFGVRPATWYSLGFDYTIASGDLTLTPNLLTSKLQSTLGPQLQFLIANHVLPANYKLSVMAHSRTQTATVGPQLAYRHFSKMTLFFRPTAGLIFEDATPKSGDAFVNALIKQLAPSGHKSDKTWFYGVGGGADFLANNHWGLRVQADIVRDHLFDDLLANSRWTMRFSIGPCFNFGKNIAKGHPIQASAANLPRYEK